MTVPKQTPNVVVSWVGTTGAITTTAQNVAYGSPYILRVDVTNSGGIPCENATTGAGSFVCTTGTVQLFQKAGTALNDFPNAQNSNATNVAKLNDRGFAEDQPIQLNAGSYSISATYTADANSSFNSNASSNALAVTITKATTTSAVVSSPTSVASGGSVTLTATVSSSSNSSAGPSGTVQFMNGTTTLGGTVACAPAGASAAAGASCKATLTTALSELIPLAQPRLRPTVPMLLVGIISLLLLVLLLVLQRRLPSGRRVGYAAAALLLLACLTAGFAGCSGSKGAGGPHTDSITAVYSGDTNYSGSTSAAVSVAVQ